jgi:polyferredoxin
MSTRSYRRFRIAIGGLVLGFCILTFADVGGWVPATAARVGLWLQFTPSLLALTQGIGWISVGCIAILLLTLVCGRIYCAMLCPLGILMDLSAWIARRTGKKRKLPFHPGHPWIRTLAVAVCAIGLMLGTAVPLGLLDPYSIFGKITSATLRPALGWLNQTISLIGVIQPVDISPVAWITIGVAVGLLAIIVISAVFRGRLWCNTVCPVGAVLGFFSRFSIFRLKITSSACVACSMCERSCPAQCIDFKNYRIDHSRCIMCLDCVTSCTRNGIHLTRKRSSLGKELPDSNPVVQASIMKERESKTTRHQPPPLLPTTRRFFLTSAVTLPTLAMAKSSHDEADKAGEGCRCHGPNRLTQHNKKAVLPPGARSLVHFQSHCTACQLCVTNCPDQVLRPSITQHGLSGFLQPYQDFTTSFCSYNCSNCSEICPTGAIQTITVEERRLIRTGTAELFLGRCVVKTEGTSCGACSEHCPTQAVHMVPWKNGLTIPEMDPDLCIGCGGCEFICPVRPDKAIIVTGLAIHERAKAIERGEENTVREMEEEFPF